MCLLVMAAGLLGGPRAYAVTLEDFGYRNARVNGKLATGTRPLLVILATYGNDQLANGTDYYDGIVFTNLGRNVVGYFDEMSNGSFKWTRAGLIGLSFSNNERQVSNGGQLSGDAYYANIVSNAFSGGFPFADYDSDGDSVVEDDELEIIVFSTDFGGGGLRYFGAVERNGITVSGWLAIESDTAGLLTCVHELMHGIGFEYGDIYGTQPCLSYVTVMTYSCGENDTRDVFHVDAWHKMQLGWDKPRVRSMRLGGAETLPAAYLRDPESSLILYDPLRGTNEFFLVEYRFRAGYDANVITNGVVIWHVQHDPQKHFGFMPPFSAGPNTELGWGECIKCGALYYQRYESASRCPNNLGGITHAGASGLLSLVYDNPNDPGQKSWRWCYKCQGLFVGTNELASACPTGGGHDGSLSAAYSLRDSIVFPPNTPHSNTNWLRCNKCEALYSGQSATNRCPDAAGGLAHDGSSSRKYSMWQYDRSVFTLAAPDLSRGKNLLWTSGSVTPYLRWIDGSRWVYGVPTTTQIRIHPFSPGATNVTVEWTPEQTTWVEFGYFGIENGSFPYPYDRLAEGLGFTAEDGVLTFKAGSTPDTATFTRRMLIRSYGGPATIGQ